MKKNSIESNLDIVGLTYGDKNKYIVVSYKGKNSSGNRVYTIKFLDSGNFYDRVRSTVTSGKLVDTKQKTKETAKKRAEERKAISKLESQEKNDITFLYGKIDLSKPTLILDQATITSGFCVLEDGVIVNMGYIHQDRSDSLHIRIHMVKNEIKKLIKAHSIKNLVLEDIFLGYNLATYRGLCCLIGVLVELSIEMDLSIATVLASVWREKYGISGKRANCKEVAVNLVKSKTGINIDKTNDDLAECMLLTYFIKDKLTEDNIEVFNWN